VRQALEILTPSMPGRMEDGNTMLTHWTKKIIVEDGHTGSQVTLIINSFNMSVLFFIEKV